MGVAYRPCDLRSPHRPLLLQSQRAAQESDSGDVLRPVRPPGHAGHGRAAARPLLLRPRLPGGGGACSPRGRASRAVCCDHNPAQQEAAAAGTKASRWDGVHVSASLLAAVAPLTLSLSLSPTEARPPPAAGRHLKASSARPGQAPPPSPCRPLPADPRGARTPPTHGDGTASPTCVLSLIEKFER